MKAYGLNELREMFLSFFETKEHLRLPSFSLVPQNDKSILLINAGMTPMKPYFKGEQVPPSKRVCTCQKCIRTGDIDNVGRTARHGTYFEMLGNFSFGDYFKHEAIAWSWEFLTSDEWVGLDADRLYPSVYMDDDEAWSIWHDEVGIPADRIFRFGKEDNFWEHGSGPCGPCSEIYYDRGAEYGCGKPDCTVGCDCDRYMEVWNNVFSQFDNDGAGNYTELVQKNIDTGMGLERLAVVCQGVNSLFDVDTVMNITNKVSEITGAHYGESENRDISLRVITDHIRSATFMICDGILPSNEGRGYVLRRLLRRAARHGKLLGVNEPFLFRVIETVVHENECQYPELREKQEYITRVVRSEEESFAKTIDAGMQIFAALMAEHKAKGETVFSGADAFKLYDTYGFPIDLTLEMAADEGMSLDSEEFNRLMQEQKTRAREARKALGDLGWEGIDFGLDATPTLFTGYEKTTDSAEVLAIFSGDELCSEINAGSEGIIVLDKTPFYAEMGGQVADFGTIGFSVEDIERGELTKFTVTNVKKDKGNKFLHYGRLESGSVNVGEKVVASIDTDRRNAIARAHSATHLLHAALRRVLGDHVHQAGSLVEPDRLRFDFTHFNALSAAELAAVENEVLGAVLSGTAISVSEMSVDEAKNSGATALFGEKYGDVVRVVAMGEHSVELCGGTHLDNTAKVCSFRILSESSVASGVRRIEAVTGREFIRLANEASLRLQQTADILKTKPNELVSRAEAVNAELRELRQTIEKMKSKAILSDAEALLKNAKDVNGLKLVMLSAEGLSPDDMRKLGDFLRDKESRIVALIAGVNDGKITFLASCGRDAVARGVKAGDIIKTVAPICGGRGGGKPDSAMGGGSDVTKLPEALAAVESFAASK
ncbi:MAG: alanine--tRNA ligase [Oscillospiraceae bacterium]|nr:alanine--tRNA ligase [Oscillospiraceae bacterium]